MNMLTCTCAPANQRPHKACFKQLQRSPPHQSQSLISQFSQLSLSRLMLPMPWTADSLRLPSTPGADFEILRLSQVIVPLFPSLALMPFLLLRSPSTVWPPPCLTTLQVLGLYQGGPLPSSAGHPPHVSSSSGQVHRHCPHLHHCSPLS